MISVYLECDAAGFDELIAELHERGTLGVIELQSGVRAWFDDAVDISDLVARYDGDSMAEQEHDWVRETEESFPPIEIGERFWLAPPWNPEPPPPGRVRLEINPGLACGTGWHPCTQLCIEALERVVFSGADVLDVGAGSGILSAAATLLGAGRVVACDVDPDAVPITRGRIGDRVFAGSADAVRSTSFDVVVANISRPAAEALYGELVRIARPGGRIILSGFQSAPDMPDDIETTARDGWLCCVINKV